MPFTYQIVSSASQDRLEKLIRARLESAADQQDIDRKIWDLFGERWAVMFTDLSGFSRQVEEYGIIHFLQTIYESHRILVPVIEQHGGILLKLEGDSMLVIFRNVAEAIGASIDMQRACRDYNRDRIETEQILLCIGLGYGDVLRIGDADVFGAEVNAASKLGEDTAGAWEILVTGAVREAGEGKCVCGFEAIDFVPPGASAAYKLNYQL
jgi:adenylate cyclase